ncbi:MAG TPA: SDR family oxidoreductase [Candidatus Polarisedimenticolia bacterium]|nr:SDR family oxidoreductase [Candidatus Polarisedimenticolia bacterium]
MASYLVTGGAGFIGSHLVETLLQRGESVRVLDDFSTGKADNLAPFSGRFEMLEGRIDDPSLAERAVRDIDFVLHQAALGSVPRSVEDPAESHAANLTGTLVLLDASRKAKIRRFVYASSSSVYGDTPELPKTESMVPAPLSPYAVTKLGGEYYCRVFHGIYGLQTVALRYFNVFGPRQRPDSQYAAVIPRFIAALKGGESPVLYGDGRQSRDFTYVENVVQANLAACSAPARAAGEAFNIACGECYSLLDLLRELQTLSGMSQPPRFEPSRKGDVRDSLADIRKAEDFLAYGPRISFREGLARTLLASGLTGTA